MANKTERNVVFMALFFNLTKRNKDSLISLNLAFQIRYRYEILPLAYLYVVYTKGGRVALNDEEDSLNELYKRPWNDPQSDNFTIKLRYRF